LLEVKVTTKIRTAAGITHDTTQAFVLGPEDATDTLASLRVIHNNLQLILIKAQQDAETEVEMTSNSAAELSVSKES